MTNDLAWKLLAAPPIAPRTSASAAFGETRFAVWGGEVDTTGDVPVDGAIYEIEEGAWHHIPPGPLTWRDSAAFAADRFGIFVWGGLTARGVVPDGAIYDPVSRKWVSLPEAPISARHSARTATLQNSVVVWGGLDGEWQEGSPPTALGDGALLDVRTLSWRPIPPLPSEAFDAVLFLHGGDVAVACGKSPPVIRGANERYGADEGAIATSPTESTAMLEVWKFHDPDWMNIPVPQIRIDQAALVPLADGRLCVAAMDHVTVLDLHGAECQFETRMAFERFDRASTASNQLLLFEPDLAGWRWGSSWQRIDAAWPDDRSGFAVGACRTHVFGGFGRDVRTGQLHADTCMLVEK